MALNLSNTYDFQSIDTDLLIREAYENINILGDSLSAQQYQAAKRSLNFLLLEWSTKSTNLWTRKFGILGLTALKGAYELPTSVKDIRQVSLRSSIRHNKGGTAFSSEGFSAPNAFDGNPFTEYNQTELGSIGYDYGMGKSEIITFFGISSSIDVDGPYKFLLQSSGEPVGETTFETMQEITIESPRKDQIYWFDINSPEKKRAYRILSITGSELMHINEIYFNNTTTDTSVGEVSREEYFDYTNKRQVGRPSVYYLDRQITTVLNIWPAPSAQYNCLIYNYQSMMEDVGQSFETIEIPARLYPALIYGLASRLAIKFAPEALQILQPLYENAFNDATIDDSEKVDLTITPQYNRNYST